MHVPYRGGGGVAVLQWHPHCDSIHTVMQSCIADPLPPCEEGRGMLITNSCGGLCRHVDLHDVVVCAGMWASMTWWSVQACGAS